MTGSAIPASRHEHRVTAVDKRSRILLAEDDDDIGSLVELSLEHEGFEITRARDGFDALDLAFRLQPDLILLDVGMPGVDGMAVCEKLRRDPRTSAASIIMVTARVLQADKVRGLDAGADDYVTKPFDPAELMARVRAALRRTRQLRDVSPLTGLPGNSAIFRHLDLLLDSGRPFALLHADLDNFKAFNDHYGFAAGDEVIKATAAVLTTTLDLFGGTPAFAGHVGGDDFVVVTAVEAAEPFAASVLTRFDELIPAYYDDHDRAQGGIEVLSRTGRLRRYPIMTISLGIVVSAFRAFSSPAELASVAAEMKNAAKETKASSFCTNRRGA